MPQTRSRARRLAALSWVKLWGIPAILVLCVTLPHLADGDWMRTDSGWYSAVSVQAWRTGELWTLYGVPGHPYFNKPPLVFWIVGAGMRLFGPGAWTARVPSIVAALASVLLTVAIGRRLAGRQAGAAAGIVLALTYEFFRRTREVSLDLWQLAFLLMCVLMVAEAVRSSAGRRRAWLMLGAGIPLGLALMTKPLMGLVALPLLGVWLAWIGRGRLAGWLAGTLGVSLLVAGPWHVSMVALHGESFWRTYFGAEVAARAAGSQMKGASADPLFYVKQLVEGYWPWLILVVTSIVAWVRRDSITRRGDLERLAVVWVVGWLGLLSAFPDRRDRYALVLFPALAWLGGISLAGVGLMVRRRMARLRVSLVFGAVVVVGAIIVAVLPIRVQEPVDPQWPALDAWIRQNDVDRLWQGAFEGGRNARLYLHHGWWATATRDREGKIVDEPARGDLIIYHADDGRRPGAGEVTVFTSGDLTVTRLDADAWSPIED